MRKVEVEFPGRVTGLLLAGAGLLCVTLGAGGVRGTRCKWASEEGGASVPVEEEAKRRLERAEAEQWPEPRLCAPGAAMVEVVLAEAYFPIDTLFGPGPAAGAPGSPGFLDPTRVLVRRNVSAFLLHSRAPLGLHNIVFVRSGGIKLAFFFCLIGTGLSLFLVLSSKDLICYTQPKILRVERVAVGVAGLANLLGGILACVWGGFKQLSKAEVEEAGLGSLGCPGWVAGGILAILAGVFQLMDLGLAVVTKTPLTLDVPLLQEEGKKEVPSPVPYFAQGKVASGPSQPSSVGRDQEPEAKQSQDAKTAPETTQETDKAGAAKVVSQAKEKDGSARSVEMAPKSKPAEEPEVKSVVPTAAHSILPSKTFQTAAKDAPDVGLSGHDEDGRSGGTQDHTGPTGPSRSSQTQQSPDGPK